MKNEVLDEFVSHNITKSIKNDEKTRIFKALNCNEKYTDGSASDFEWFDAWESAAFLCAGHKELLNYTRELSELNMTPVTLSEHSRRSSIERWRSANLLEKIESPKPRITAETYVESNLQIKKKSKDISYFDLNEFVSKITNKCKSLSCVSERAADILRCEIAPYAVIKVDILQGGYERPDPYSAQGLFVAKKSGEFLNSTEENIILFQILTELLIHLRGERSVGILIKRSAEALAAVSLARYLDRRRLFDGEIWIEAEDTESLGALLLSDTSSSIRLRPFIDAAETAPSSEIFLKLFSEYPVGAFTIKGGRECGALISALREISESRQHFEFLIKIICV